MRYNTEKMMTEFTPMEYIKLGAANAFGLDKEIWSKRLDWFEENKNDLYSIAGKADEPFQYIKACKAYEDALNGVPTGYCVGFDSTASGVQMFAALSNCKVTAAKVNLVKDDQRHDLYKEMGKALAMDVPRQDLKDAIMTFFYSSESEPERVFGERINEFITLMRKELPGAFATMQVLKTMQVHIGESYELKTPDGFDVLIRQKVIEEKRVECSMGHKGLENWNAKQQIKVFGPKKRDRSIPANVAHICDGWVVRNLTKRCHALGFDMYHVHDCFFCSPKHMNKLRYEYKKLLAELSESNYLYEVVKSLSGKDVPALKGDGSLAEHIMGSDYAIC